MYFVIQVLFSYEYYIGDIIYHYLNHLFIIFDPSVYFYMTIQEFTNGTALLFQPFLIYFITYLLLYFC